MNKIHRLIWSVVRNAWIVAPENANSRGKPASSPKRLAAALVTALIAQAAYAAPAPNALPTGGQVVAGQAAISQAGSAMTIQQGSDKAILNWNSFSIGSGASVNFQQPNASAVALNRVTGADPSAIYGSLTANGQVFLVNPNGVLFGAGARVDVGGLVASTLNIRNEDFLAGINRFTRDGSTAGVTNQGELIGKYVALLAPEVRNEGVIAASMGTAALAAGEAVTLGLTGNSLIDVQVEQAQIDTLVENKHLVKADGGNVVLSAQSAHTLLGQVVNSGAIEAQGISTDGGSIQLLASSNIDHSGSINADAGQNGKGGSVILMGELANSASQTTVSGSISAKGGSTAGDGGFIETSGTHLTIADGASIDTSAANGKAGQWLLDPVDFTIAASGGDLAGAALTTALGLGNVTISTTAPLCTGVAGCSAGTGANGDIFVNDTVSWAANALTLSADRHIVINSALNVTGTGGLNLKFDQVDGGVGQYFVNAPVNLAATSTFTTQWGPVGAIFGTGLIDTYTVLTTQAGLMAMTVNDPAVRYVLGSNVTASGTWTPIGPDGANPFFGVFDGLGHVVSNLNVSGTTDYQGMFGMTGVPATVQNIGLTNANVSGTRYVGALVGANLGSVYHSYASGTVTASTATATPITAVGGLVGQNDGVINGGRSSVNVTATSDTGGNVYAGGMNDGGIGGLAGISTSSVSNSFATGSVSGLRDVGGLVGWADMNVATSYATGAVTLTGNGTDRINVGGLIGNGGASLAVATSFWDTQTTQQTTSFDGMGSVTAGGMNTANMQTAANFTSATAANGNANPAWDPTVWTLANGSYPSMRFSSGGLATVVTLTVAAASKIYGDANPALPGLTLSGCSGCISISGWGSAMTTTTNAGDYAYSLTNLIVLNYAAGTSASDYTITWADPTVYKFTVTPRTVTVTPTSNLTKVYNGQGGADPALTYANIAAQLVNGDTLTPTGALARAAVSNVGNHAINLGSLATGSGNYTFALSPTTVNFSITPKALTMSGLSVPASKVYDGTTTAVVSGTPALLAAEAVGTGSNADGMPYQGDVVSFTGTAIGTYNSKNVATASTVSYGGLSLTGTQAGNYSLTMQADSAATITQKPLTVTAPTVNKFYNGTTSATGNATVGALAAGDAVNAAAVLAFTNKHAGTGNKTVVASGLTIKDGGNADMTANYNIVYTNNTVSTIYKAALTVTASTNTKTYDGTTSAAATPVRTGALFGTDSVTTLTEAYTSRDVGTNLTLTPTVVINDGNNGNNYQVMIVSNMTGVIEKVSVPIVWDSGKVLAGLFGLAYGKQYEDTKQGRIASAYLSGQNDRLVAEAYRVGSGILITGIQDQLQSSFKSLINKDADEGERQTALYMLNHFMTKVCEACTPITSTNAQLFLFLAVVESAE
ncbi:MAG: YDG domain-containing protein [Gallionella sp.]|nr:YDG domain-containing protein [Gallionella sp.]